MSKQSDAKIAQRYDDKPVWKECRNCKHFASDKSTPYASGYIEEKNLRCTLGGFSVKKLATCRKHEPQE